MLACGNRQWHHLAFEYPAEEKLAFDRFVTRASYALKSTSAWVVSVETNHQPAAPQTRLIFLGLDLPFSTAKRASAPPQA